MIHDIRRVLTSNMWVGLIGLVSSMLFPRVLTISDYAYYQTFAMYLSYVGFFHLGVADGVFIVHGGSTRLQVDRSQFKSEAVLLVLVVSFFTVGGAVAFALTGERLFAYLSLCVIATNVFSWYRQMLQAWGEFRRYALLNVGLPSLILACAVVLLLTRGRLSGEELIAVNVLGYVLFAAAISAGVARFSKGNRVAPVLSAENMSMWRTGLSAMLGGIATIAFLSVGRQIVWLFYPNSVFAIYSFAMSLQAVMTLFIGAIAQPLYWRLASRKVTPLELNRIKEALLSFGAMSGIAYFACVAFVSWYVPKYSDSIPVVLAYFTVFPAMSVVNCLYVNLYKASRQMRKYVRTVALVLLVAVALSLATLPTRQYVLVAVAVSLAYYFWLLYAARHFSGLAISMKDVGFLATYLVVYFCFSRSTQPVLGALGYAAVMGLVAVVFYGDTLGALARRALRETSSRTWL